jgi:rhamnulokinase
MATTHLAIDLGASSGRAILGRLSGEPLRLAIEEVHRFEHRPCETPTGPVWDLTGIWREIICGLAAAVQSCKHHDWQLTSVGVDAWGVDWVFIGRGGELIGLPHCYRDPRNAAACESVLAKVGGHAALYARTGIQLLPFNTLFQLAAARTAEPRLFDAASRLLFLPDLFHYWLSGERAVERTIASTSSMLDARSGDWDRGLLEHVGIDGKLLGPLVEPGTRLGLLRPELAEQTGAPKNVAVIIPASHDTASAVAATPAENGNGSWAYLSSGTWSLLGTELAAPLVTCESGRAQFTNERGANGRIRFLKNIAGLWLVQELRRELAAAGDDRSYAELERLAAQAEPFRTLINPNDARFASPGAMRARIAAFAATTNQPAPDSAGQFVRSCLDSLALCYGQTLDELASFLGAPPRALHIVGGGSQNQLLSRLTAGAIRRQVISGPIEASAIGNCLVQAMGTDAIRDLPELREIVARSFEIQPIVPLDNLSNWAGARRRYAELAKG